MDETSKTKLETYLRELEQALSPISITDRYEIIMELSAHITESLESKGESIDQVLSALGDARQVANRYLIERKIEPVVLRKSPWRWLGYGAMTVVSVSIVTLGIATICILLLARSLFPVIETDEAKGRVRILGGLIDVNDAEGKVSIGHGLLKIDGESTQRSAHTQHTQGNIEVKKIKSVAIFGNHGDLRFEPGDSRRISYSCDLEPTKGPVDIEKLITGKNTDKITFHLNRDIQGLDCEFQIPATMNIESSLQNGQMDFEGFRSSVHANLQNGELSFRALEKEVYQIEAKVMNGEISGLDSRFLEANAKAHQVHLKLMNGRIEIADK